MSAPPLNEVPNPLTGPLRRGAPRLAQLGRVFPLVGAGAGHPLRFSHAVGVRAVGIRLPHPAGATPQGG